MALPQVNQNRNINTDNPYEHLSRQRSSSPGWSWKLFSFSILILIIVAVIYLGIQIGYKPFLNSRIKSLDNQLEEFESKISMQDQQSFINFYSQVVYLEEILDGHIFFSPFFDLLERNTHQGVFFSSIDYEIAENKISIEGQASSFEALGQQLARFDALPEIRRTILSESRSLQGGISFQMLLFPERELFTVENRNAQPEVVEPEPIEESTTLEETATETNDQSQEATVDTQGQSTTETTQ